MQKTFLFFLLTFYFCFSACNTGNKPGPTQPTASTDTVNIFPVTSFLMYRLWPAYSYSADIYLKIVLSPLLWPDLIWLGLLPGLSEELLFRGVMLADLGVNTLAVVVSSLAFGVLHFSGEKQWPYVIWATVVGFILGYSAIATDNLLVPIIAHVFTNLMSGCFWKLKYIGRQP